MTEPSGFAIKQETAFVSKISN